MADYPRFNQTAQGFKQLTAVVIESGGWRRARQGERIHLVVARVYGVDTFAGIQIGEIDGLSNIQRGVYYGVNEQGDLTANQGLPFAIGVSPDKIIVYGTGEASASAQLYLYQPLSDRGVPGGYCPLGSDGIVPSVHLPPVATLVDPNNLDLTKVIVDKEAGQFVMDTDTDPATFVQP